MNMEMIKVVWITSFSNELVRKHLPTNHSWFEQMLRRIKGLPKYEETKDYAVWNTNGIIEFEKFNDVELHIVGPYTDLCVNDIYFEENGIHYHFFRNRYSSLIRRVIKNIFKSSTPDFKKHDSIIRDIVSSINPDVIHLIGAENPWYSQSILSLDCNTPIIVQLQTLMMDPDFLSNYNISEALYNFRTEIEKKVVDRADYVGGKFTKFKPIIKRLVRPDVKFLNIMLAVSEPLHIVESEKKFDFVYFGGLDKALDLAVESFAIVCRKYPNTTLDVIGPAPKDFLDKIQARISELGLTDNITFEGLLPSHDDVIDQINKSRFALLPLKIDILATTIFEAMSNGLPVVTTITPGGTPTLNEKRESLLLSEIGDHQAMADNMLKLLENKEYAKMIHMNAIQTASERDTNEDIMKKWVEAYKAVLENFHHNKDIPQDLIF